VLRDVLSTWAQQVDARKGALKYNIPMYTRASLSLDLIEKEDYLIAVDVLRSKALAVLDTLDQLARLPGAAAMRTGSDRVSLGEIRAGLIDTLRFRLQPLTATITQSGATSDARRLRAYVDNQLVQARERQAAQQRRVETLQRSLDAYSGEKTFATQAAAAGAARSAAPADQSAVTPQISESFLDRIMDMSKKNTDVKYRQDMTARIIEEGLIASSVGRDIPYYEDLLRRLPTSGAAPGPAQAALRAPIRSVYDSLAKSIDQLNVFYTELSAQNLNSQAMLYTPAEPFSDFTARALTIPAILMYAALTFLLALFIVPILCLVHHAAATERQRVQA